MTKEQGKAIERLEKRIKDNEDYKTTQVWLTDDVSAVYTVLNMLKEKEAEIEELKKSLARNIAKNFTTSMKGTAKAKEDLEMLNKGWQIELEKKDKIIDLMADYIATLDIEEDICVNVENDNCDKMSFGECEDCIKKFFERKATNNG